MMTSSPRFLAISTVSSLDTSSTRITLSTMSCGMSAYVRSSVRAALYAGMTMTRLGRAGSVTAARVPEEARPEAALDGHGTVMTVVRPYGPRPLVDGRPHQGPAPHVRTPLRQHRHRPRHRRAHPARPVPDGEVPGP